MLNAIQPPLALGDLAEDSETLDKKFIDNTIFDLGLQAPDFQKCADRSISTGKIICNVAKPGPQAIPFHGTQEMPTCPSRIY